MDDFSNGKAGLVHVDCKNYFRSTTEFYLCCDQESRREGWTDARSAVGFCLGSGLFGSYNSD